MVDLIKLLLPRRYSLIRFSDSYLSMYELKKCLSTISPSAVHDWYTKMILIVFVETFIIIV